MPKVNTSIWIEPAVARRLKVLAAERGEAMGDTIGFLLILRCLVETGTFHGAAHRDENHMVEMERRHVAEARELMRRACGGGTEGTEDGKQ